MHQKTGLKYLRGTAYISATLQSKMSTDTGRQYIPQLFLGRSARFSSSAKIFVQEISWLQTMDQNNEISS